MPGITDLLWPAALLGVGAYTIKKIVTAPTIAPVAPQNLAPINAGYTAAAPISSSTMLFPNSNLQTWASAPQMPEYMTISDNGKSYIKQQEGYRNMPYQDAAGYWTVGIGHKIQPSDNIPLNQPLDDASIMTLFDGDLSTAESIVKQLVNVPITQGQFDALTDFVFNLGRSRLASSTLLRLLNAGNYAGAAAEFNKWVYAGGKVDAALVARRQGETQMFMA